MFLGGIWCSSRKPPTVTIVEPTIKEINKLEIEGQYLKMYAYMTESMSTHACIYRRSECQYIREW